MIKENKRIIVILILGMIFIFSLLVIIFQVQKKIKENYENLISYNKELLLTEEKTSYLEKAKKELKENEEKIKRVNNLFIDSKDEIQLIELKEFFKKIANDSKITISISETVGKNKFREDSWDSLSFNISAQSTFSNLMKFLERINNNDRYLIEISQFSLKKAEKEKDLVVNLSLKVFTKK